MSRLLELLGTNAASPGARELLARYPALRSEIEELGPDDGLEPVRYLRSEDDGLLIKCSHDGEVRAVFFMSEGKDGFAQFRGPLPGNLTFASTPGDAVSAFGSPAYRRPAGKIGPLEVGELLRFDWPNHSVHFQFRSGAEGIDLVTAMTARSVPGRRQGRP